MEQDENKLEKLTSQTCERVMKDSQMLSKCKTHDYHT